MPCTFHLEQPLPFERLGPGCQFQKSQFPKFAPDLIEFDGKTWCPFHLPMESADGTPSPKAGWSKKKVKEFNEAIFAFIDKAKEEDRFADLTGMVFPGDITFDRYRAGISELPSVTFFRAHFSGNAGFHGVFFRGNAGFHKTQFSDAAEFYQAQFSGNTDFKEAQFRGNASFEEAVFSGDAGFEKARFGGGAGFGRARFGNNAGFQGTQFDGDAGFEKVQFGSGAGFGEARFGSNAGFQGAQFDGDAGFEKVQFGSTAWFDKTQFGSTAWFKEAQFDRSTRFKEARFDGNAWFLEARFGDSADFSGAPGAGDGGDDGEARDLGDRFHFATFAGAKFEGPVRFSNRRFLDHTNFFKCVFTIAPEFHNCPLHQDTDFTGARFLDTETEGAARAYRTLKLAMEQNRARDGEAMFYALEMESRQKRKETPISVKVFSWLYERAADYGRSFMRPLGWLSETAGIFFLVYLICFAALTTGGLGEQDVGDIGRFTMRQIGPPFDAFTLGTTEGLPAGLSRLPLWLGFVAMIQSILSLGLIALFILALRRRFRMG